ncbi:MAG: hemolysin family protein [Parachlamydiales bacterium]
MILTGTIIFFIGLFGSFVLQAVTRGFRSLEQTHSQEQLRSSGYFYFYRTLLRPLFGEREQEALLFSLSCARHAVRYILTICLAILLYIFSETLQGGSLSYAWVNTLLIIALIVAFPFLLVIGDYIPRALALRHPEPMLRFFGPFATLYLLIALPATLLLLLLSGRRFSSLYMPDLHHPVEQMKEKIVEMIQQAPTSTSAEEEEKALLESVAELPERIVREIMVPRIDIFGIEADSTLKTAIELLTREGYSRAPVYRENLDHIVGLLMYRDLMGLLLRCSESGDFSPLDQPVSTHAKPVLFVPETSSVIHLLREFRQKQSHLAVVVDEYGGTEGIVTIENCLEEIVGEIADEYDEEEPLFVAQEGGGWIVDARMSILDIEDAFDITIPQEGDYDTIGGYAFHRAGEIPPKGLRIHHDDFELEILESSDRCVEKVLIIPTKKR